jgi:hypothetical protein
MFRYVVSPIGYALGAFYAVRTIGVKNFVIGLITRR